MPNGVKWCKNRREDVTLTGTFFHNVDKKDRIFIPAKIREELGLSFVMSIPFDGQPCISIYTKEYWNSMKQRIDALPYQEKMLIMRVIGPLTDDNTVCDAQGRVHIPAELKKHAGLSDKVCIIGTSETLEIWNEETWQQRKAKEESEGLANILGRISL